MLGLKPFKLFLERKPKPTCPECGYAPWGSWTLPLTCYRCGWPRDLAAERLP